MPRPPQNPAALSSQTARAGDRLFARIQRLLPQHALSRVVLAITRLRAGPLKDLAIRVFVRHFRIDMSQAREPDIRAYPHFNAFFTRALRPEVRPVASGRGVLASPADATISQLGRIERGQVFQAKGHTFGVDSLLGAPGAGERFAHGSAVTLYLSPRDYHRVHMPADGRLLEMRHVPGRLFSVNPATTRALPGLFARNERLVCTFDTDHGRMAVVLVGAMFVGCMETVWAGVVTPPRGRVVRHFDYGKRNPPIRLGRGEELGRFNMGSTVILLLERPVHWAEELGPARPVRMGEALGVVAGG